MLRDMQKNVKKKSFNSIDDVTTKFRRLKNVFQSASILIHFDSKLFIRLKTNAFDFEVADIISQLQSNNQWHFVAFYSRKMISAKRNYETHDQELLTIIMCFKHWKHYLKSNLHFIEILIDYNNLKRFINVQILSDRQTRWALNNENNRVWFCDQT